LLGLGAEAGFGFGDGFGGGLGAALLVGQAQGFHFFLGALFGLGLGAFFGLLGRGGLGLGLFRLGFGFQGGQLVELVGVGGRAGAGRGSHRALAHLRVDAGQALLAARVRR